MFSSVKVEVSLTEEEKRLVPDWELEAALFQRHCDERTKDRSKRFRLCLHEGGHAVQYRNQFGWDVKFHGPDLDFEDGKLEFVLGAVSPVRTNNYEPFHWQHGMVSIAGFWMVEHFIGLPGDLFTIQSDLKSLRSVLGENEDMNLAEGFAKLQAENPGTDATDARNQSGTNAEGTDGLLKGLEELLRLLSNTLNAAATGSMDTPSSAVHDLEAMEARPATVREATPTRGW